MTQAKGKSLEEVKPREFWVGISDSNVAHINEKQIWPSDYHVIEYAAIEHTNKREEIYKSLVAKMKAALVKITLCDFRDEAFDVANEALVEVEQIEKDLK